jgi:hypothetical protein
MSEYSDMLIVATITIAFIAGYSIVSFLIRYTGKKVKSMQLPPINKESKPTNKEN